MERYNQQKLSKNTNRNQKIQILRSNNSMDKSVFSVGAKERPPQKY